MNRNCTRRSRSRRALLWLGSGLTLIAMDLAGCGRSSPVREIPEAARKSVLRKKVDVEHRPAVGPRSGQGSPHDRTTGPRS
jgi:hypothetical protein